MNSKECLENIKTAPGFMGGNRRYKSVLESRIPFLEDIETIKQDLDKLEKLEKENQELRNIIKILKDKIELPLENDFDVVNKDDIHLYRLRTKCLINEKEYDLLKEVLEKC